MKTDYRPTFDVLKLNSRNEKIKLMRKSQISTAEYDYGRRIQDLDIAVERADVTACPVAYGVIRVERRTLHAE